jgi:hypothetical protein
MAFVWTLLFFCRASRCLLQVDLELAELSALCENTLPLFLADTTRDIALGPVLPITSLALGFNRLACDWWPFFGCWIAGHDLTQFGLSFICITFLMHIAFWAGLTIAFRILLDDSITFANAKARAGAVRPISPVCQFAINVLIAGLLAAPSVFRFQTLGGFAAHRGWLHHVTRPCLKASRFTCV